MKQKSLWSYAICVAPFFMWQTAIALALGTVPALAGALYTVLGIHYFLAGISLVLSGLICDKAVRTHRARRVLCMALAATGGVLTFLLLFIQDSSLFIAVFLIATVFGFGANGVLTGALFVPIPQSFKPMGVGLPFAFVTLLRIPIDLSVRDGLATYKAMLVFCAAGLFLMAAALLLKPVRQAFSIPREPDEQGVPLVVGKGRHLVRNAIACGALVYIMFGIAESFMTASSSVIESILILRVVQIAACVAVGIICRYFGYYASVISSISFLGFAMLAHLFSWSGAIGVTGSVASGVGFLLFALPLRAIFAEVAKRGKYLYTVSAFGYGLYFLMQIIGFPLGGLIKGMQKDIGMAVYIILFMLTAPLLVLLFYSLRNSYHTEQAGPVQDDVKPDIWAKYHLSRREREILELVLKGLLSREIAELLFVAESTVNWHVANILKKTGHESRSKLIEMQTIQN